MGKIKIYKIMIKTNDLQLGSRISNTTVMIKNLNIRINEIDLFLLFTQKVGKVSDIIMNTEKIKYDDKNSALIILDHYSSKDRALRLKGIKLYSTEIIVEEVNPCYDSILNSTISNTSILTPKYPYKKYNWMPPSIKDAANNAISTITAEENKTPNHRPRNILISNIPSFITSASLTNIFSTFGTIISTNLENDNSLSNSKVLGTILYLKEESALIALNIMNLFMIGTRKIKISVFSTIIL